MWFMSTQDLASQRHTLLVWCTSHQDIFLPSGLSLLPYNKTWRNLVLNVSFVYLVFSVNFHFYLHKYCYSKILFILFSVSEVWNRKVLKIYDIISKKLINSKLIGYLKTGIMIKVRWYGLVLCSIHKKREKFQIF